MSLASRRHWSRFVLRRHDRQQFPVQATSPPGLSAQSSVSLDSLFAIATTLSFTPMYRVNGVVRNVDAWYEAFGVREGDALFLAPEKRVRIW